jgi:hypothetical protein
VAGVGLLREILVVQQRMTDNPPPALLFDSSKSMSTEIEMNHRTCIALALLLALVGCGSGDKNAKINNAPLTDAEKAAIKAADDAVNAEESAGRPGNTGS